MFSVFFVMLIIIACTWISIKWMYPRPPQGYYMPKVGDSLTLKNCHECGHSLAEWRGIVDGEHFFCNQEHQQSFHDKKAISANNKSEQTP